MPQRAGSAPPASFSLSPHALPGDASDAKAAAAFTAGRASEANNTGTHDVGFMARGEAEQEDAACRLLQQPPPYTRGH